jgi:hypothetical protein
MRSSNIQRQSKGRRKTRFGIILDLLLPRHQNVLLRNELAKTHSDDDIFLYHIFRIEDKAMENQHFNRIYIDPHTNECTDMVQMNRNLKLVHWKCAYCRANIESQMDYFKPDNFVCSGCHEKYIDGVKWIPDVILQDSLSFTKYCTQLLRKDQKEFIEYLKKGKN